MRSGFVSIIGRPNAGKSTLLNALIGEKVAIVTAKPQTTRTRIHGIVEVPERKGKHTAAQVVFVDTPGIHRPASQLDRAMLQEIHEALMARDLVLLVVDAVRKQPRQSREDGLLKLDRASEEAMAFEMIRNLDCPVFLVVTKIDLIPKERLLPLIADLSSLYQFAEVIPVSAKTGDGLKPLLHKIAEVLPEGKRWFPKEQFTDQPERFLVAELIRERILVETGEEVPYASTVVVERFEEASEEEGGRRSGGRKPLTRIAAAIYCEREGQKAILIGKGGSKLRDIGASARREIEALLGTRVYLELHVLVREHWRDSRVFVESLNWRRQLEELAKKEEDGSQ